MNCNCKKLITFCFEIETDIRTNYRKDLVKRYKGWFGTECTLRNIKFLAKIFKWKNESPLTPEIEKNMIENSNDPIPKFMSEFAKRTDLSIVYRSEMIVHEIAVKLKTVANACSEEKMFISVNDMYTLLEYKAKMNERKWKEIPCQS